MRLARTLDNKNWEPGFYRAIYQSNLRIVHEVQKLAVKKLKESIVRSEQTTGTLGKAIEDSRAVYADGTKMIVGVGDFLDIAASYWRPVEFGAPGMVGEKVYFGFWTRALRFDTGKLEGPIAGEKSGRPIIMGIDEPPAGKRHTFWTIKNPTQAHYFFQGAWDEVGQSGRMEEIYREEIGQVIGPNGRPFSLPERFQIYHERPPVKSDFTPSR